MSRLETWWVGVRDSLWFVPAQLTVAAVVLAILTVELDNAILAGGQAGPRWAFTGGAEGARGVLTAISGGLITVTGVVFSVTIVALQLASTQFTPRVLRNFTADRANQVVLGIFIATFTYALLVLRLVRSAEEEGTAFVPPVSITVAIVLALISISALIFFINHMARSIQASVIIDRVTHETLEQVDLLFPEILTEAPSTSAGAGERTVPAARPLTLRSERSGYLQAVDEDALLELGHGPLHIQIEVWIGEFVLPGTALAALWPADSVDREVGDAIRDAFVLGQERTPYQDVEYGLIELADIAVKALSPAVNDPTTATICIDRLAEILLALGRREFPARFRAGKAGRVRFMGRPASFDRFISLAFDQIRHYCDGDATVLCRLLDAIGRIARLLPEERRAPLARQVAAVLRQAERTVPEPTDLERIRVGGDWAVERTAGRRRDRAA